MGDVDGRLGSGATGRVVIDSGDPAKGFKSYDWWGPIRAYSKGWSKEHTGETTSSLDWDRWTLRNLYVTGGDGGLFFDLTDKTGSPFSVVVEDCVTIGRAFGGGVAGSRCRPGEPLIFRRSYLMCLDWWGDAAGAYVRAHNAVRPAEPDVVFDDCTLVGPDNAVQIGYPSFTDIYTRVQFRNCRLIVLNFSQPGGTPSSGIICCDIPGATLRSRPRGLHAHGLQGLRHQLRDRQAKGPGAVHHQGPRPRLRAVSSRKCRRASSASIAGPSSCSTRWPRLRLIRRNRTATPRQAARIAGPERDGIVAALVPGPALALPQPARRRAQARPERDVPVLEGPGDRAGALPLRRAAFAGLGLRRRRADPRLRRRAFGERLVPRHLSLLVRRPGSLEARAGDRATGGEHLLNSSVCRDEQGYLMAYESDKPVAFCFKFARSKDLVTWEKIPGLVFRGTGNEYSACPVIRYIKPYYYVIYLHAAIPGHNGWVSFLARSKDLATWELSPKNPILEAGEGEGCNNSDVDLIETRRQDLRLLLHGRPADLGRAEAGDLPRPDGRVLRELLSRGSAAGPGGCPVIGSKALSGPPRFQHGQVAPGRGDRPRQVTLLVESASRYSTCSVTGPAKLVFLSMFTYSLPTTPSPSGTSLCPFPDQTKFLKLATPR